MKKIEAIIREERFPDVKAALEEIGVIGMTVVSAKGRGSQKGITLGWRVGEYRVEFLPKVLLMIVIKDDECDRVIQTILEKAYTGRVGDGKIFVSTIDKVYRVRTRESGDEVL